jgi:outer membrane protein assembly factor BamB
MRVALTRRTWRRFAVIAGLSVAVVAISAASWPTDHGSNLRGGYSTSTPSFAGFHPAFSVTLDGAVYGSPIQAGSLVVVATENNSVYGLDPNTGAVRWHVHLVSAVTDTSAFACPGNISPSGITSTPVYDPATGRVFVVTVTDDPTVGIRHEAWGLRASDGATVMARPMATIPGNSQAAAQQRGALAVANGNLYIAFGGLAGDCGAYRGAVVSMKTSGAAGATWYVVPTGREGGIWAPGGPVVASNGDVYVSIGNGESTTGAYDYSDSVTKLSPTMQRLDYYAPRTWASDNAGDKDLGSLTPAFLQNGLILQAGKSGNGYILRQSALGHLGGQLNLFPLCSAFGVAAVTGNTVYLPCTSGVTRVDVFSNGSVVRGWTAAGIPGSPVAGPGAIYSLANGNLYALNGRTGAVLASVAVGQTTRFATPALIGSRAYVGTTTGLVALNVS